MDIDVTYERDWGIGWIAAEPAHMRRASHALVHDGRVWLIDPVDGEGLAERIARLGEVAGVVQLLDRHPRDCAALAARYGVPLHETPDAGVPGTPFGTMALSRRPGWREVALWWPQRRVLAVADALGTAPYFTAPGERLGVHPMLRLSPPRGLLGVAPEHLLVGHGAPLHGPEVPALVRRAIERSRREIPSWVAGLPRAWRGG